MNTIAMIEPRELTAAQAMRSYDLAIAYLKECAEIDELERVRSAAERMAAYERQVDDPERAGWLGEIVCRAVLKIGHESKKLETHRGERPIGETFSDGTQTKREVLAAAGITKSKAHRYECLASADGEDPTAAESYYATCKEQSIPPTQKGLASAMKADIRAGRVKQLAGRIERASGVVGTQLFGVIYADPPWRFEPFSRDTGLDRAADNHYPTMTVEDIAAMKVPAADDCALFLWATAPMLMQALYVLDSWGFLYKTHWVWSKDRTGTGFWTRSRHELLLLGIRGTIPAPAPGKQYASVIEAAVGQHSVKPACFAEMIEDMFPGIPLLEMFGRQDRLGWTVIGAEAPSSQETA